MARADLKYVIGFETNDTPVVEATRALKKLNDQQTFLSKEYKKGNISQSIFKKGQRQLNAEIERLRTATKKGGSALNQYINQMDAGGKATRRAEVAMQQTGYQLQDFIVQIQAGTNPLIAFSQQGSQLAGFFAGPWGAAIGLGIAALGGLGTALLNSGLFAEGAERKFKSLKENIESLKDITISIRDESGFLVSGFRSLAQFKLDQSLQDALLELSQRTGGQINATNFEDIDVSSVLGRAKVAGEFGGLDKLFETALSTGTVGLLKEAQEAQKDLSSYEAASRGADRINKDRAKNEAEINSIVSDTMELLIEGPKRAAEEQAASAKALLKSRELLLASSGQELSNRGALVGLSGEQLFLAKQELEKKTLLANLEKVGLDIGDYETQRLVAKLGYLQEEELRQFRIAQAERDRAKAQAAQRKKELEHRKKLAEAIRKQNQETQELKKTADRLAAPFETFFMSIVDGTATVGDAFKSMASEVIKELYRIFVVKKITGMISGAIEGVLAGPQQGPTRSGQPLGYFSADGGGYTGNAPRSGGLDGKGGFMAMLHPRETVVDHTKGQSLGGGDTVTVNQTINVTTGVQQTVRTEIKQLMPQIAESAKAAVVDAKRRGGSYGRAFA